MNFTTTCGYMDIILLFPYQHTKIKEILRYYLRVLLVPCYPQGLEESSVFQGHVGEWRIGENISGIPAFAFRKKGQTEKHTVYL